VLTLQNGSGHEDILEEFVSKDRIIIGTTEDNGAVLSPGCIKRGGTGNTNVGMLVEDKEQFLPKLKEDFESCGFHVAIHSNIQQLIWNKLFTNVSLSAVTGILQVDMGYIAANEHAWNMTVRLIKEAVLAAKGLGLWADENEIMEKVRKTSEMSPYGCTSIRSDLQNGRRTEVDTISGSVVRAAKKCGIPVPTHEFVVEMIHAMEGKGD
jgi:2-dehydropantoate 2-reductase